MKFFKKAAFLLAALMMVLEVSVGFQAVDVSAAPSKTPQAAYKTYMRRYLYDAYARENNGKYNLHNLDKKGATELFVKYTQNGKNVYKVYTYRKKNNKDKITLLGTFKNANSMSVKGTTLCVSRKIGSTTVTTYYKQSGLKLLKQNEYEKRANGACLRNGKVISVKTYNKNVVSVADDYANVFAGAKKIK